MRLDMAILADAATAPPDGKLYIHGGGITRITAPVLPWTQPQLAIVARFLVESGDEHESHALEVTLASPQGQNIFPPAAIEIPTHEFPGPPLEGEERFMQMALAIAALTFAVEGVYRINLTLDGEHIRSLPLAVVGTPAQGPPAPDSGAAS